MGDQNSVIYTASFSDSVIMFSKDDSERCFELISAAAALLVLESVNNGISLKGGMAHGLITVNKSKQIFFGQPIIDAYEIQEDVTLLRDRGTSYGKQLYGLASSGYFFMDI